ncbi:hypothetical protein MRX96_030130 [Rhipicephalus microplus]
MPRFAKGRLAAMLARQRQRQADTKYTQPDDSITRCVDHLMIPIMPAAHDKQDPVFKRMRRQEPVIQEAEYSERVLSMGDAYSRLERLLRFKIARNGGGGCERCRATGKADGTQHTSRASVSTARQSARPVSAGAHSDGAERRVSIVPFSLGVNC